MTDKAYERAFREHMLVDAALNTMLFGTIFGTLITHENTAREPLNHTDDEEADMIM